MGTAANAAALRADPVDPDDRVRGILSTVNIDSAYRNHATRWRQCAILAPYVMRQTSACVRQRQSDNVGIDTTSACFGNWKPTHVDQAVVVV